MVGILALGIGKLVETHPAFAHETLELGDLLASASRAANVRHLDRVMAFRLAHVQPKNLELLGGKVDRRLDLQAVGALDPGEFVRERDSQRAGYAGHRKHSLAWSAGVVAAVHMRQ